MQIQNLRVYERRGLVDPDRTRAAPGSTAPTTSTGCTGSASCSPRASTSPASTACSSSRRPTVACGRSWTGSVREGLAVRVPDGVPIGHEAVSSPGPRRRRTRCARRPRRGAEAARDPAQLPGDRPPPVPAREVRTGAAPVHRHLQRRGAAVQPGPAALGLCLLEAGELLLRLRHRQRRRERRPATRSSGTARSPGPAPPPAARRGGCTGPGRQGRGPRPRAPARVQTGVGGQHLGDELRVAVRERDRGAQPRRGPGRLLAEHRRGRAVAVPPQRR